MFKKREQNNVARKLTIDYPKSIFSEQFRSIRANINFSSREKEIRTLLITSASVGEGKSTIAANIAIAFAQEGKKVLLVDADLRKPTIHVTFNRFVSPGLTHFLRNKRVIEDIMKDSGVKGLKIITSGPIPLNPTELLSSNSVAKFIKNVKEQFDIIIFDAPPLLPVADAQILSEKCDGTILVVSSGITDKISMIKAKEALHNSKANVIGAVLNNFKLEKEHSYYNYYIEEK